MYLTASGRVRVGGNGQCIKLDTTPSTHIKPHNDTTGRHLHLKTCPLGLQSIVMFVLREAWHVLQS